MECIFASAIMQRSGSSVWLEYLPVTQGVAGSSPVQTARLQKASMKVEAFFSNKN